MSRLPILLVGLLLSTAVTRAAILQLDQDKPVLNHVRLGTGLAGLTGATPGQFRSAILVGVAAPVTGSSAAPAPAGVTLRLSRVRALAPYLGQSAGYLFGAVIPVPDTDENGNPLASPGDYWEARPFVESDRLGFEWNAQRNVVVAKESGTFQITWQKREPEAETPADLETNPEKYHAESGLYFRLYAHNHTGVLAGNTVQAPAVREDGTTALVAGEEDYWLPRPHTLRESARYYFSEAANAVFATQVGPVSLTWRRKEPSPGNFSGNPAYVEEGGNYFRLHTQLTIVSGSAVKTPRKIYWTGGGYPGTVVSIPADRIADLRIVYNTEFPENVPVSEGVNPVQGTGLATEGGNAAAITATLWYSEPTGGLNALNRQGRVFVEYLGPTDPLTGKPEHLGFEVVDVLRSPTPETHVAELGDPLPTLYRPSDSEALTPLVANPPGGDLYAFRDIYSGPDQVTYFAVRETRNPNDLVMWWLEPGVQGVLWPDLYVRYQLIWPTDVARYSHYLRSAATTREEALATAVQLDGQTAPAVEYQDPLDRPRAEVTGDFKFFTWLDATHPVHRTLLRRLVDGKLSYERVFSWLDSAVVDGGFSDSLATGLDAYDPDTGLMLWPEELRAPRVVERTVAVGQRIEAPLGEPGSAAGAEYLAGYVNPRAGTDYNANAYLNPFDVGFAEATRGAIIPVNARPGHDLLEVWWFRPSQFATGANPVYWPSAIGRYTLQWPDAIDRADFATDFERGLPAGTALFGTAFLEDGAVILTPEIGSRNGALVIDDFQRGEPVTDFTARFRLRIDYTTHVPADGLSFSFARDIADGVAGSEDGVGSGLRVTFDTFDNGGADSAPAIEVIYGGAVRGVVSMDPTRSNRTRSTVTPVPTDADGNPLSLISGEGWAAVEIRLHADGTVDVLWNDVTVLSGIETPYLPIAGGRFAFTARTGGYDAVQAVDDVVIGVNQEGLTREIVLASNDGSGPLASAEAAGSIYVQNDSALPGYNPNEEHALMQGGQAYALRDDLNLTDAVETYSSAPYVLLGYTAADGRPAMSAFRVLREKPEAGIRFRYAVEAPQVLQAPMPLPLLELPLDTEGFSVNSEISPAVVATSAIDTAGVLSTITTVGTPAVRTFGSYSLQNQELTDSRTLYVTDVDPATRQVAGVVSAVGPRNATYVPTGRSGLNSAGYDHQTPVADYQMATMPSLTVGQKVLVVSEITSEYRVTTVAYTRDSYVGLDVAEADREPYVETFWSGLPVTRYRYSTVYTEASQIVVPDGGITSGQFVTWTLAKSLQVTGGTPANRYTFQDRKGSLWVYRGPHDQAGPDPARGFEVQYYYRTLPGFYFPAELTQPALGTVVPYLRARNADGSFAGSATGYSIQALPITYLPAWPSDAPEMFRGETLTVPKRGLPAVRGQSSAQVLYQQSLVVSDTASVRLHDPTREKQYLLGGGLDRLPDSARTDAYLGKSYFPNLPPHLVERFLYDGSRGTAGALVLKGEFVEAALGESYLLLNALGAGDIATLKGLVTAADTRKTAWDAAIDGLTTTLQTFVESTAQPGTYVADGTRDTLVGLGALAEITDDDVAVDSYALSASGPGHGFVTLMFGNGEAFTPEGDPVSLQVIQVVDELYRGEVKPLAAANPLNEKITLQQVIDLGARQDDYTFDWRIASPVDGLPPVSVGSERRLLLGDGSWNHLRFPLVTDAIGSIDTTPAARLATVTLNEGSSDSLKVLEAIPFSGFTKTGTHAPDWEFTATQSLVDQNAVSLRDAANVEVLGRATEDTTATLAVVRIDTVAAPGYTPVVLTEAADPSRPASVLFRTFATDNSARFTEYWLSLDLAANLGARVYVDGQLALNVNVSQFLPGVTDSASSTAPAIFDPLTRAFRLGSEFLRGGTVGATETTHQLAVELYSVAAPDTFQTVNVRLEAFEEVDLTAANWIALDTAKYPDGIRAILGGTADVRSLADNYLIMRYRPTDDANGWSRWTTPALAEGWIKRVLAGINPFNQRVTDFLNNRVNTDATLLAAAGTRWEGDVALNLATIEQYGLIPIYETVLRRGRSLSIDAGINYGPANDALLLAAGYLNDLYMILGNEARADATNPTIGIGTADRTYGDIATAMFSFKGQVASLLDEELALLRGRDDFLQPGVQIAPVYNRLVWNYTRGIDSGEVIYALNYNIQEDQDQDFDGIIGAEDAAARYPQGHGDAYGHYLTATKGYYSLLIDGDFTWVPRIEAVNVLGVPVSVDYLDERKFAAAAAAVAEIGEQVFELTWREDYEDPKLHGWEHFGSDRTNTRQSPPTTRYWGMDHWASRTGQGALLNWVVGNSILPAEDTDPTHEGIQVVDRTTVVELAQLASVGGELQSAMDNAESGLNPLGLPAGSIAFDLNPSGGSTGGSALAAGATSHFEQVLDRAKGTLRNAVVSFDDAKDITRLMRSEEDSLADFQAKVDSQEQAFEDELIELYGTPYPEDVGPGATYTADYSGPDLVHFRYVDNPELYFGGLVQGTNSITYQLDIQQRPAAWWSLDPLDMDFVVSTIPPVTNVSTTVYSSGYSAVTNTTTTVTHPSRGDYSTNSISFTLNPHGFFGKPSTWTGHRASPGRLQEAIGRVIRAHNAAQQAVKEHQALKYTLDRQLDVFEQEVATHDDVEGWRDEQDTYRTLAAAANAGADASVRFADYMIEKTFQIAAAVISGIPSSTIAGTSNGGELFAAAKSVFKQASNVAEWTWWGVGTAAKVVGLAAETTFLSLAHGLEENKIEPALWDQLRREHLLPIDQTLSELMLTGNRINIALIDLQEAIQEFRALEAKGLRLQEDRLIFRKRAAAITQGYRTRDAAFRLFRNEKLERYKSLFDLAARYAYLAAQAYDYDTGLLGTDEGEAFLQRIIRSRALGVVKDGQPQFAGSNTGDPGLSSVLAEMEGDWQVLKGRLGFNNPDVYGTTVSLRQENFRILPGADGDVAWKDLLARHRMADILEDADVRRYCLQADNGDGLPVPGIVLPFSTVVASKLNLFGRPLAAGDSAFSPSTFATKIFSVGVALQGYQGMANPSANAAVIGNNALAEPDLTFLDQDALAATPYLYLVPVGVDAMRSPPLGDASEIRVWQVNDVTIPLPFNLGASAFSGNNLLATDSLTEPLFSVRKHQAFRPVSDAGFFAGDNGRLLPSTFTNSRLIGRSVWNTGWKLVIPGPTLLNDPDEGLERFIRTVKDVQLHFETYSYSGN